MGNLDPLIESPPEGGDPWLSAKGPGELAVQRRCAFGAPDAGERARLTGEGGLASLANKSAVFLQGDIPARAVRDMGPSRRDDHRQKGGQANCVAAHRLYKHSSGPSGPGCLRP
jgi:hypothetical protein